MAETVKMPESADEAAAMLRVGAAWLQGNAPEVLRATMRATADAKDAERYRWLRAQHWSDSPLCVVADPKDAVKMARCCPSGDLLDIAVDDAMAAAPAVG